MFIIFPWGYISVFKQTAFCDPKGGVIILIYISQWNDSCENMRGRLSVAYNYS